jgi:hypothetical protein
MAGSADRQPATDPGMVGRIDLAAALRLAGRLGLQEGISNHSSLAVPEVRDRFLLNPWRSTATSPIVPTERC